MIKDVVSNFFYNKNPYPVITRARKKPEPAPQPLTKKKNKYNKYYGFRIYASCARSLEFRV